MKTHATNSSHASLRLVAHIARGYSGRGLDPEDLVSEGYLGLITAAERFDPRFNTRFSTYASYWIKQAIRHVDCNTTAMIRLPMHAITLLNKWRRVPVALEPHPSAGYLDSMRLPMP